MPRRPRFTPAHILDTAVDLVRAEGLEALSARNLASALGCSTGPLFSTFSGMDEISQQTLDRIVALFVERAAEPAHADPLVSAGLGWLSFAADEPRLYEALFLRPAPAGLPPLTRQWGPVRRVLAQRMAAHPRYAHLDDAARFALVGRASIVLHGLGLELWSGRLGADGTHTLLELTEELVIPVVDAAMAQGRPVDLHTRTPTRSAS